MQREETRTINRSTNHYELYFETRVLTGSSFGGIIIYIHIAGLCKGSRADSDSVCEASSPSPAAITDNAV